MSDVRSVLDLFEHPVSVYDRHAPDPAVRRAISVVSLRHMRRGVDTPALIRAVARDERVLVAEVSYWLRSLGHDVSRESRHRMVNGRVDLVIWDPTGPAVLVEFKTSRPMAGVAQLISYAHSLAPKPLLVLVIQPDLWNLRLVAACMGAGIVLISANSPTYVAERLNRLLFVNGEWDQAA